MMAKRNFSAKREAIYKAISSTDIHPDAEWVYEYLKPQIPDLSLGTVYRNLAVFKETGLVKSIGIFNGHERFDSNLSQHSHFVCTRCFCIKDVPKNRAFTDANIYNYVESECDVTVHSHSMTFYGLCAVCSKKITISEV